MLILLFASVVQGEADTFSLIVVPAFVVGCFAKRSPYLDLPQHQEAKRNIVDHVVAPAILFLLVIHVLL